MTDDNYPEIDDQFSDDEEFEEQSAPAVPGRARKVVFDVEEEGVRLDQFIADLLYEECSRSTVRKWIDEDRVSLDPLRKFKPSTRLHAGDRVTVDIPPPDSVELTGWDKEIEFVYRDSDIAVLIKPPGMAVHPGPGHPDQTLVNALLHHFGPDGVSSIGRPLRGGIVHRLDLPTHGLMIVALTDRAHLRLVDMFAARQIDKYYRALCVGRPPAAAGTIKSHIGRHPTQRFKMTVLNPPAGREAVSLYRLHHNWTFKDRTYSYLHIKIETGRTHQIRVHLKHEGCPVVGDTLYSRLASKIDRYGLLLSAYRLKFEHPITKKSLEFEIDPPQSFLQFCEDYGASGLFEKGNQRP